MAQKKPQTTFYFKAENNTKQGYVYISFFTATFKVLNINVCLFWACTFGLSALTGRGRH